MIPDNLKPEITTYNISFKEIIQLYNIQKKLNNFNNTNLIQISDNQFVFLKDLLEAIVNKKLQDGKYNYSQKKKLFPLILESL